MLQCDRGNTHACVEAYAESGPAQLAANETPCETAKFSAILQCSWGHPSKMGRSDLHVLCRTKIQRQYVHSFTSVPGQDRASKGGTVSKAASWCVGIVHPIFKAGDGNDLGNYRGITVVVILAKLPWC